MLAEEQILQFKNNGFLAIESLLDAEEVVYFRRIYEDFLNGKIKTGHHRSDLSGLGKKQELITQIMRPSVLLPELETSSLHKKVIQLGRELLGEDMEVDFDMLINKAPHTNTPTPWHQDEAYWINMPDKRAVSFWVALDDVSKENGCMWFVPQSHQQPLRHHEQMGNGGALQCQADEQEAVAVELPAGGCSLHSGRTIHYSRGNSTDGPRRAFIINMRPKAMIELERSKGFDHLGKREARQQK